MHGCGELRSLTMLVGTDVVVAVHAVHVVVLCDLLEQQRHERQHRSRPGLARRVHRKRLAVGGETALPLLPAHSQINTSPSRERDGGQYLGRRMPRVQWCRPGVDELQDLL